MFGRDVVLRFGGFFGVRKVDLRNTGMFAGCRRQAGIDCVIIMCISRGKARQFFFLAKFGHMHCLGCPVSTAQISEHVRMKSRLYASPQVR